MTNIQVDPKIAATPELSMARLYFCQFKMSNIYYDITTCFKYSMRDLTSDIFGDPCLCDIRLCNANDVRPPSYIISFY